MACTTFSNQGASVATLVQGLHSNGGNICVSVVNDKPEKRLDLLDWLSPISIDKHHEDLKFDLVTAQDSGSWFLKSDQYLDWMDPTKPNRVLWCPGLPGAGKTVMASLVIDQLTADAARFRQSHENSICWLYLGHADAKVRPGALLAALLRYMVRLSENIPHCVEKLYQKHLEAKTSPTDDSIMSCLIEICQGKENIFLIVDAMDEYSEAQRNPLIGHIYDMLRQLPALRILITSRFLQSIEDELDLPSRYDIEAHDNDLEAFVRTQLSLRKNQHLKEFAVTANGTDVSLVEKIVKTVVRGSDKIFLLAKLQLDYVASKRTKAECLAALDEPPMDRNALYEKTMDRIKAQPKEDRDWAIRILTWVCRAGRALTIDELQVAIQPEPFSGGILNDSSKLSNEDILEFCGGLISINTHTNSVVFFHDTVREYFSQNSSKHFPEAHDMIVSRCTIRLATAFSAMISRTTRENSDRSRDLQGYGIWSLLEDCRVLTTFEDYGLDAYEDYESQSVFAYYQLTRYSLEFLGHHVREAEEILTSTLGSVRRPSDAHTQPASVCDKIPLSQKTYQRVYDLISESKSRELLVRLLVYDGQYAGSYRMTEKPRKPTAIHVASSLGLYRTTVSLLDTSGSSTVNDRDSNDETAVMIAMRKNYSYLVTLFVQRGADVDLRTKIGREVLLYAAGRGLILIADNIIAQAYNRTKKRKLARKLEFSSRAPDASVLLLCAAYHDDCTTVTRLLRSSKFIRIASKDGVLGVCLLLAAQKRRHSIVRTLLDKGVDIDSRDATGRTALHRAADWNDKDLVEMLLKYNADVDIKDNKLETAWSSICGNEGHAEVEAILVKAKTDVNTKGEDGVSALYLAAAGGHTTIVRRLLRSGTDPNIATLYGWCPLHWAAGNGHYDCTELLLQFGAVPNPLSDTSLTPLDIAVTTKNDRTATLLLEYQAKRASQLVGQQAISHSLSPSLSSSSRDPGDVFNDEWLWHEYDETSSMTSASIYQPPRLPAVALTKPVDTSSLNGPKPKKERWWKKILIRTSHTGKTQWE